MSHERLADDVPGRTEEAGGCLGHPAEPARAECSARLLVAVPLQIPQRVQCGRGALSLLHDAVFRTNVPDPASTDAPVPEAERGTMTGP